MCCIIFRWNNLTIRTENHNFGEDSRAVSQNESLSNLLQYYWHANCSVISILKRKMSVVHCSQILTCWLMGKKDSNHRKTVSDIMFPSCPSCEGVEVAPPGREPPACCRLGSLLSVSGKETATAPGDKDRSFFSEKIKQLGWQLLALFMSKIKWAINCFVAFHPLLSKPCCSCASSQLASAQGCSSLCLSCGFV